MSAVCREWDVSIRRACGVLEFDRSTYHYRSRRPDQAGLEARIKEICATRVRYGYRRVHVLLRHEVREVNIKRTDRIYNELGLQLRNKTPKRQASQTADSAMIGKRRHNQTRLRRWTSSMISWPPARRYRVLAGSGAHIFSLLPDH